MVAYWKKQIKEVVSIVAILIFRYEKNKKRKKQRYQNIYTFIVCFRSLAKERDGADNDESLEEDEEEEDGEAWAQGFMETTSC